MSTPELDLLGDEIYRWALDLFPLNRSLTGEGVRETLRYLRRNVPEMNIIEVPSGTPAMDWIVPDEWNVREAFIEDQQNNKILDYARNNLHVLGYSVPVEKTLSLDELQPHLHSLPDIPEAIPYLTSYYVRRWGFCLSHRQREALRPGTYHVRIDAQLAPGNLTYGEIVLPGELEDEIFFSTYVCHPSLANDQLSGIVVLAALARWLSQRPRRFTYRLIFIPETIGSAVYLSRHLEHLRRHVRAGLVVACVGDERTWSMTQSRNGDTLSDRLCRHLLRARGEPLTEYPFLWPHRGSDERNWCMPGVDLPMASFHRSKYTQYPEYHTSLDDLSLISPAGLAQSFEFLTEFITALENNRTYKITTVGEPRLGPRGLYPTTPTHQAGFEKDLTILMNVLAYADGSRDVISLAERINENVLDCLPFIRQLLEAGLLAEVR